MNKSKKLLSLLAIVLCLAFALVAVFAFSACDDANASGDTVGDANASGDTAKKSKSDRVAGVDYIFEASGETDEKGITPGIYTWLDRTCGMCGWNCSGHDGYMSPNGVYYYFYPYIYPLTLTDENGDESINSELQVSLIFEEEPYMYDDGENVYFYGYPAQIEIASLTGEPLNMYTATDLVSGAVSRDSELNNFRLLRHVLYDVNDSYRDGRYVVEEVIDEEGADVYLDTAPYYGNTHHCYSASTETAKCYGTNFYSWYDTEEGMYYIFYITTPDREVYTCDFYTIVDYRVWDAVVNGIGEIEVHR